MRELRYTSARHGVIRTDQIRADKSAITRDVKAGLLHRRYRGVYAVGHPHLSPEGEALAAVFAAGPGAVLASLNAAVLWRISRFRPTTIDVVTATRRRPQAGFRTRARPLKPGETVVLNGIPVMTVARVIVDLGECLHPEQLANVIHEAAFRKRFDERAVRAAMVGVQQTHTIERALQMYAAGSAGTRSGAEDRFMALVRAAKLKTPVINTHIEGIEVDFCWGRRCVEIDGPGHDRPHTRAEDERRDAWLQAKGYTVIRISDLDEVTPQQLARRVARK